MRSEASIIAPDDPILVTGASGFIGPALIDSLLRHGFRNVRAFVRPSSDVGRLEAIVQRHGSGVVDIMRGNLLSTVDCSAAARDVAVIFHLATGGSKSFPDAFVNSAVTTRNLLEVSLRYGGLRRFVNISSFAVYANTQKGPLNEDSPIAPIQTIDDAYSFAKLKQDEIVADYGSRCGLPYVIVRPGTVIGPGKSSLSGRIGLDTFGVFLHLGGSNQIPVTFVDNCADAITLAGITPGVDGEVFNVVDDDLPSSRHFLRRYKKHVARFKSLYIPPAVSFVLCWLWEKYSSWSAGQLPPAFSSRRWRAEWKPTRYDNNKLKRRLGWTPVVPMEEGLLRYFQGCRGSQHA